MRVKERSLRVGGCARLELAVAFDGEFEDAVRVVKERFFSAVTEVVRRGFRIVETVVDSNYVGVFFDEVAMQLHVEMESHGKMSVIVNMDTKDLSDITEIVKIVEETLNPEG